MRPLAAVIAVAVLVAPLAGWGVGPVGYWATGLSAAAAAVCVLGAAAVSPAGGLAGLAFNTLFRLGLFLSIAAAISLFSGVPNAVLVTLPFYATLLAVDAMASMGHTPRTRPSLLPNPLLNQPR